MVLFCQIYGIFRLPTRVLDFFQTANDKNFNGVVMICFRSKQHFQSPNFSLHICFQPLKLNWLQNRKKLCIIRENK